MKENDQSRKLMEINAYYQDLIIARNASIKRKNIKKKFVILKRFAKYLIHLKSAGLKKTLIALRYLFNDSVVNNYEIPHSFDHSSELDFESSDKYSNKRIVVYTSIFGGYDDLQEPLYKNSNVDYIAITDREIGEKSVWKKLDTSFVKGFESMDGYHKSKFCKFHPHVLFPDYDISVWVDGNVKIVGDIYPVIDRMTDESVMATFENPQRDCIYTEGNFVLYNNYAKSAIVSEQLNHYKNEGFPKHYGMREFSIIVRKHNEKELISFMQQWWEEVNKYSMRDQISLPYILWKNGKTIDYIQPLKGNWRENPRFFAYDHSWHFTAKN